VRAQTLVNPLGSWSYYAVDVQNPD
jgi:hypothetical protein